MLDNINLNQTTEMSYRYVSGVLKITDMIPFRSLDRSQQASVAARNAMLYIACVAWRFWLGALSNKGGRGERNREEIEAGAT